MPRDAFCLCGLSWFDFYPSQEVDHILGDGTIEQGTAAFTFGHYALFKEREFFQASNWKSEYTLSKPCNVSSDLSLDGDKENGYFDFVTENEKEEAKLFTLECDQEGCAGSKLLNSPSKIRLRKSNSFKTLFGIKATPLSTEKNINVEQQTCSVECDSSIMRAAYDENSDPALTPNTIFDLNCKVLRRIFRVSAQYNIERIELQ